MAEDADDVAALLLAAQAVADAEGIGGADRGYRLIFNVGPDAMNSVAHLHLHCWAAGYSTGRRAERHPPVDRPADHGRRRPGTVRPGPPGPLVGSQAERTWQAPR